MRLNINCLENTASLNKHCGIKCTVALLQSRRNFLSAAFKELVSLKLAILADVEVIIQWSYNLTRYASFHNYEHSCIYPY